MKFDPEFNNDYRSGPNASAFIVHINGNFAMRLKDLKKPTYRIFFFLQLSKIPIWIFKSILEEVFEDDALKKDVCFTKLQ